MLSKEEQKLYSRQIRLPELGEAGQARLKSARVLVVGCGGLGSPLLRYLASAGIGTLGLVDFDKVEVHNLHRQILFTPQDVGKYKAEVAAEKLKVINPHIDLIAFNTKLEAENALEILKDFDIIADGTDNFPTRYLINDACVKLGKVNVFASIHRFEGQMSVFNYRDKDGNYGPNYRDLFPTPPKPDTIPNCEEAGVIGAIAGVMGSFQANEIIKIAAGMGSDLSGKLLCVNLDSISTRIIKYHRRDDNEVRTENAELIQLIDYDAFCGIEKELTIKEIDVDALVAKLKTDPHLQVIDVRNLDEYKEHNMGAILIPAPVVYQHLEKIPDEDMVVIHCKSGARSAAVINVLQKNFDYDNLYNLTGGIMAWEKKFGNKTIEDFVA